MQMQHTRLRFTLVVLCLGLAALRCGPGLSSDIDVEASNDALRRLSAPSNLRVTGVDASSIALAWDASSGPVSRYDIWRGDAAGANAVLMGWVSSDTRTWTAAGLSSNTPYTFTVRARDSKGRVSAPSNTVAASTSSSSSTTPVAPSAPSQVRVTATTTTSVSLAWNPATGDVAWYNVWRADAQHNWVLAGRVSGTTLAFDAGSLSAATTYQFGVRAESSSGQISDASNIITATTASEATSPPSTNVTVLREARGDGDFCTGAPTANWDGFSSNSYGFRSTVTNDGYGGATCSHRFTNVTGGMGISRNWMHADPGSFDANGAVTTTTRMWAGPGEIIWMGVAVKFPNPSIEPYDRVAALSTWPDNKAPTGVIAEFRIQSGKLHFGISDYGGSGQSSFDYFGPLDTPPANTWVFYEVGMRVAADNTGWVEIRKNGQRIGRVDDVVTLTQLNSVVDGYASAQMGLGYADPTRAVDHRIGRAYLARGPLGP